MVNTIIQGARTPFTATLDGLKIEAENEKLNDLTEIGSVVIMIIIILVFHNILNSQNGFLKKKKNI